MVGKGQLDGGGWGKSFSIPIVLIKEKEKMSGKTQDFLLSSMNSCVHGEQGGGVETELLLGSPDWPSGEVNAGEILISALLDWEVPLQCGP